MITEEIELLLKEDDDDKLLYIHKKIAWLGSELFGDYEPRAYSDFQQRFYSWLGNLDEGEDKRLLYRLIDRVSFIGRAQMASLFRTAFNDPISRWVIEEAGLALDDPNIDGKLDEELGRTWICPITDSMRINKFLKVNDLEGHTFRPDWFSLAEFGEAEKIRNYCSENHIARLVLLEDFVGSGSQMTTAADFALAAVPEMPILVVPLICCPDGTRLGRRMQSEIDQFNFDVVLELPDSMFVKPEPVSGEPDLNAEIRALVDRTHERLPTMWGQRFGHAETGALAVLHSNCPDNALPILHDDGEGWDALFPRVKRKPL